jgi:hypothetical protein
MELTGSDKSEYVCEGVGQMRCHTTQSESVVCARQGRLDAGGEIEGKGELVG